MADPTEATSSSEPAVETVGQSDIAVDLVFNQPDDDTDSALGDDQSQILSTVSITSTILQYRKIHGRTYHNFGGAEKTEYWAPNDETANEQLDINHHLLNLSLDNKLYLAPLDRAKVKNVLDLGTGTGIWAIDFADEFPDASVTGVDLSPIQPSWVPPNLSFEIDDISGTWTYPDNKFDYIHIRYMTGSVKDWVAVYREAYRCLKPGGWIEHMDCAAGVYADDGSMPPDHIFVAWLENFRQAGSKIGQTFEVIDNDNYIRWLEEAGFKDVSKKTIKVPVGGWPANKKLKEIGLANQLSLTMGIEGFGLYILTNVLDWKYDEVQVFLANVRAGLKNKAYHGYCLWGVAWSQKPLG
ncbi:S-adenosyl-L-methionine-dependent methyltransferase [Lasiosphaeria hispida]|uniref:S-adenosyl-L-methionine-dependent methyltransferase n=1 Tax=Lasiosphaeria hispida TaxID=260671 RepID=A0AAJ0HD02_9PEZI|nr:S-adenosyl-L-methionine-dependent methyltransferase [Lasiosphaeria hispida]